jgi:hypothetical protein
LVDYRDAIAASQGRVRQPNLSRLNHLTKGTRVSYDEGLACVNPLGPNQLRRGDRYAGGVPRTIFLAKQMEKKSTANEQLALAA